MKRWFGITIMLLIIAIAAFYLFVPGTIHISSLKTVNASTPAALRYLADDNLWTRWWPGQATAEGFIFRGRKYRLKQRMYQSFGVEVKQGRETRPTTIVLLPLNRDSFEIEWKGSHVVGLNPMIRLNGYNESRKMETDFRELLTAFSNFISNTENTYGYKIKEAKVKDSIILVSTMTTDKYPIPDQLYRRIADMKKYAADRNAVETNHPMLNIDSTKGEYYTRIGIPIDREIEVQGNGYQIKRMVLGNILISEVTGGPHTVRHAIAQTEKYMADYERRSPAIPYESLVTDRSQETDTAKWKTRVYYPVY